MAALGRGRPHGRARAVLLALLAFGVVTRLERARLST